jgi:DNA-binding NtrC family response regulator
LESPESHTTILLVDDDPDVRTLTRTFLAHEGYDVHTAGDAERAIHIFRRAPHIHLLVTDYSMPRCSGMELARDLQALRPDLRILIISGAFIAPIQVTQMRASRWHFLAKPFSLPELLARVHAILQPHLSPLPQF